MHWTSSCRAVLGAAGLFALTALPALAKVKVAPVPSPKAPVQAAPPPDGAALDPVVLLGEALEFFEKEDDELAVENLINKILQENWYYPSLMEKVLSLAIERKNRVMVYTLWKDFASRNGCLTSRDGLGPLTPQSKNCVFLKSLWTENLEKLLFFENSAPHLEAARRALAGSDCITAQALLDQVRGQEGASPQILIMQRDAADCQSDKASANKFKNELKKLLPAFAP